MSPLEIQERNRIIWRRRTGGNHRQPLTRTCQSRQPSVATGNRNHGSVQIHSSIPAVGLRLPDQNGGGHQGSRLQRASTPNQPGAALSRHDPSDPAKNSGPTRIRSEPHRSQSSPQYPPTSRRRSLQRTGYLSLPTRNPKLEPRWPNQARKVGPAIPRARPCPKRPFRSQEELQGKFLQR